MTERPRKDRKGKSAKRPELIPKAIRRIMQKAVGDPKERRSLTPEEARKLAQWNREHPVVEQSEPRRKSPQAIFELIFEHLAKYDQTRDGHDLMSALSLYFRYYAVRGERDLVVEALRERYLRAWERWENGRMDPWDGGSAPVRTLGQAFHVSDRDGNWKPSAATALIAPMDEKGERASPGAEERFVWAGPSLPLKEGEPLTPEYIPSGVSVVCAVIWTVEQLLQRGFVKSLDPHDERNAFVEAARLLSKRPGVAPEFFDGRTRRGHLGWVSVKTIYIAYRPKKNPAGGK